MPKVHVLVLQGSGRVPQWLNHIAYEASVRAMMSRTVIVEDFLAHKLLCVNSTVLEAFSSIQTHIVDLRTRYLTHPVNTQTHISTCLAHQT
jgi:hypothetical protein